LIPDAHSDHVFLITGASSGIGARHRRQASAAGYRLALAARSTDRIDALATELGGPERAIAVTCDVNRMEQQEALVRTTLDRFRPASSVGVCKRRVSEPPGFLAESAEHCVRWS